MLRMRLLTHAPRTVLRTNTPTRPVLRHRPLAMPARHLADLVQLPPAALAHLGVVGVRVAGGDVGLEHGVDLLEREASHLGDEEVHEERREVVRAEEHEALDFRLSICIWEGISEDGV